MDMASVRANSVIASITEPSEDQVSRLKLGADKGGRLDGNSPTVRIGQELA